MSDSGREYVIMRTALESIVVVSVLAALSSVELLMLKGSDPQGWSVMMQRYGRSPLLGTLLANLSIPPSSSFSTLLPLQKWPDFPSLLGG